MSIFLPALEFLFLLSLFLQQIRTYLWFKRPKETGSVIKTDPYICKDDNARFKTVPLKALSDRIRNPCLFIFCGFSEKKVTRAYLAYKKQLRTY